MLYLINDGSTAAAAAAVINYVPVAFLRNPWLSAEDYRYLLAV